MGYQIRMAFEVNLKWYTHTHMPTTNWMEQYETYQTIFQTILVVAKLKKPQQHTNRMREWARVDLLKYCIPPKDYHIHTWKRKWWFREKKKKKKKQNCKTSFVVWFGLVWRNVMLTYSLRSYCIEMAALELDTSKTIRVKWMDST